MPYYCTVPQCTSMAGKAKDVSFHQFPRDIVLAQKWNVILKRGKPYTKYSKVCSRHFTAADYTMSNMGKNGQWRSLRKDALPSQNLPLEMPNSKKVYKQSRSLEYEPLFNQQHMASLFYLQAMAATMNLANLEDNPESTTGIIDNDEIYGISNCNISDDNLLEVENENASSMEEFTPNISIDLNDSPKTYKCTECHCCFKDPSVYELHRRTHQNQRCSECGVRFGSVNEFNNHIKHIHSETGDR